MFLTIEDIELLLEYSNLDIFYESCGGIDAGFYTCPACGCNICCDDYENLHTNYRYLIEHEEDCILPQLLELKERMEKSLKELKQA